MYYALCPVHAMICASLAYASDSPNKFYCPLYVSFPDLFPVILILTL